MDVLPSRARSSAEIEITPEVQLLHRSKQQAAPKKKKKKGSDIRLPATADFSAAADEEIGTLHPVVGMFSATGHTPSHATAESAAGEAAGVDQAAEFEMGDTSLP